LSHAKGLRPSTTLCLKIDGEVIESTRRRQFDAFMNALAKYIQKLALPQLIDYAVRILQEAT
jgi:D-citramalate synthase